MADYIYLLDHRLSAAQRSALLAVRELARAKALTVFLVGGAVRDLTSGSPVRDLDVVMQGNVLKLRKDFEALGAVVTGTNEASQAIYCRFPGGVRMEIGATLTATYPKPGKPVFKPAPILEDLRRRDFTANAMALSLNGGSYGLLMDPLNGVADIENRQLRLVSNYGFIEEPVRMLRAARFMARSGWTLDEKTQARYETGKAEDYIATLSDFHRGYETEEIIHEEDPLRVLKRLEAEGWMKVLAPSWTAAKVNLAELEHLREVQTQLQMQGIQPDASAANFPLLTAKLSAKEVATLKGSFPRQGFVKEIEALEGSAKELATQLAGKSTILPSQTWKLLTSAAAENVLWVAATTKNAGVLAKLKNFYTVWPQARQKMPYTVMLEMRITPDLPGYEDLLEKLFFELMDEKLQTPEEMKAFLEPFSPPAPPPPVNLRRLRAVKKEPKVSKARARKAAADALAETLDPEEEGEVPTIADEKTPELPDVTGEDTDELEVDSVEELEDEAPVSKVPARAVKTVTQAKPTKAPASTKVKEIVAAAAKQPASRAKAAAKAPPAKAPKSVQKASTKPQAVKKQGVPVKSAVKPLASAKPLAPAKTTASAKHKPTVPAKASRKAALQPGKLAKNVASTPKVEPKKTIPAKPTLKKAVAKKAAQKQSAKAKRR